MAPSNWWSSVSNAGTSTSAFMRHSSGSRRSVSTAAASISAVNWRRQASEYHGEGAHPPPVPMPANLEVYVSSLFSSSAPGSACHALLRHLCFKKLG